MSLKHYLESIRLYSLLPKEDIDELIERAQGGCILSRNKVVGANLRLVIYAVRRFGGMDRVHTMDLISEGNMGLIEAVNNFDLERNKAFTTCAYWHIIKRLRRYLQNHSRTVRIPVHRQDKSAQLYARQCNGETLSDEDLLFIQNNNPRFVSLNKPMEHGGAEILDVFITDNGFFDKVCENDFLELFATALSRLGKREQNIIERRFEGETLESIAKDYNLTRERIRQVEKKSIERIQNILRRMK